MWNLIGESKYWEFVGGIMKVKLWFKWEYFYERNKKLINCLATVLIIALSYVLISKNLENYKIDPTWMGLIGAILGAIVAGGFTLFGSIYVHNNQLKSRASIDRLNTVYKPLYEELIGIKNKLKISPFYVHDIRYKDELVIKHSFIQYTVWNKFMNGSEKLEIPEHLIKEMKTLTDKIKIYLAVINKANEDVEKEIKLIFEEASDYKSNSFNYKDILMRLTDKNNKNGDFVKGLVLKHSLSEVEEEELQRIEEIIYDRCYKLDSVRSFFQSYNNWVKEHNYFIDNLESIIKLVKVKYEKQNKYY